MSWLPRKHIIDLKSVCICITCLHFWGAHIKQWKIQYTVFRVRALVDWGMGECTQKLYDFFMPLKHPICASPVAFIGSAPFTHTVIWPNSFNLRFLWTGMLLDETLAIELLNLWSYNWGLRKKMYCEALKAKVENCTAVCYYI